MLITRIWKFGPEGILVMRIKGMVDLKTVDRRDVNQVVYQACEYDMLYGLERVDEIHLWERRLHIFHFSPCCPSGHALTELVYGYGDCIQAKDVVWCGPNHSSVPWCNAKQRRANA